MHCISSSETQCSSSGGHVARAGSDPAVLHRWKSGHRSSMARSSGVRSSVHGASRPRCIFLETSSPSATCSQVLYTVLFIYYWSEINNWSELEHKCFVFYENMFQLSLI